MTQEQFIKEIAKYVQKYAPKYNIKVCSPIIAQACLESAYGTSKKAQFHNYFGLKYRANRVKCNSGYFEDGGSEQNTNGTYTNLPSNTAWYSFSDMESGVEGYFQFTNISTYSNLKGITNPETYLKNIKADGYATSLNYVDNLMSVIKSNDLTQYDFNNTSTNEIYRKYYRVQIGVFSKKSNAESLQKKLKSAGFDCIIQTVNGLYKCQVGAFGNKSNAEMYLDVVKEKGFDAFVTYC